MDQNTRVLVVQSILRESRGDLLDVGIADNLYRMIALIEKSIRRDHAPNIVVLPEFSLTGLSSTLTLQECLRMARRVPGPETAALGEISKAHGMYIAGATWETDPDWPGRMFNTAYIVGPSGEVELRYRKINEGNFQLGLLDTTPGDIYGPYVERYGHDSLFPVLETDYGTLACMICFDLNFPETARALALRGAEIILNPTGEPYGAHREVWEYSKRTRAAENLCYWVSANHGGYIGTVEGKRYVQGSDDGMFDHRVAGGITASDRSHGGSEVIDYMGRVIAEIGSPGEAILLTTLDMKALRDARRYVPDELPVAQSIDKDAARVFALGYGAAEGFPLDVLTDTPLENQTDGPLHLAKVIDRLRTTPYLAPLVPDPEPLVLLGFQAEVPYTTCGATVEEVTRLAETGVAETARLLDAELARTGAKFVVLPYGWPVSFLADPKDAKAAGRGVGLSFDGKEVAAIAEWAADRGIFVSGAFLERDPGGGAPYRTAFIVDDAGNLVHRHRSWAKGARGYEPDVRAEIPAGVASGPAGLVELFPICRTKYGAFATVIGREMMSVEINRLYAYLGAEVVLNPSAEYEPSMHQTLTQGRTVRASENHMYYATVNQGHLRGGVPGGASRGSSEILGFDGQLLCQVGAGRTASVHARIDLLSLRRRRRIGAMNKFIQLRPQLYVGIYSDIGGVA